MFDNEGSSTVQYMRDSLMNGRKFSPNVYAQNSNQEVFAQGSAAQECARYNRCKLD